jgi:hypothetical protein
MVKEFSKEGARIFAIDINDSVEKLIEEADGEFIHLKQTYLLFILYNGSESYY